jgi:hypothetical protein
MAWNDPSPPPKQGVWKHWTYGKDIQRWALRCGPMFYADIRRIGEFGNYYAMLNSDSMANDPSPKLLQQRIEVEIVRRVRLMLPVYRIIHARAMKKQSK